MAFRFREKEKEVSEGERKGIKQVSLNKKKQGDPRMGEGGDPCTNLKKKRNAFIPFCERCFHFSKG
jgi:hypothetical protein